MRVGEGLGKIWKKFFPKKEKVAILIDGENLYNSLVELGGIGIDFGKFKNCLIGKGEELARPPIYYTSVDTENPEKTLRFLDYLESQEYEIKAKALLKGKKPKSEIDPWISDGIFRSAIDSDILTIILVSGDHHFLPAVNFAKERGKKVKIVSIASSLSEELKRASDEWLDLREIIKGITRKSKIEQKREKALKKLNKGEKIALATLEKEP
ncbi:NYN domain-containing protein [Patescibacteria group bacterium]|nr:NYN domain-containing protein [Patescibacteria group bacterium]